MRASGELCRLEGVDDEPIPSIARLLHVVQELPQTLSEGSMRRPSLHEETKGITSPCPPPVVYGHAVPNAKSDLCNLAVKRPASTHKSDLATLVAPPPAHPRARPQSLVSRWIT